METLLEFECPACGGALQFDPGTQLVKCPYCDTEFTPEALREANQGKYTKPEDSMNWQPPQGGTWGEEQINAYVCRSCGGELLCDANTAATRCPYCDSPVVLTHRVTDQLRPDLVIPFKLDKDAAKEALQRHMSGKPLLPKCFKSENRLDMIQGLYVPFWLFDAEASADMRFRATKVRHWSDSNYNYTRTSHFSVHRAGTLAFEAVPVDASSKMANDLMESIEPYDLSQAVDFDTAYLAGYLADKYDVSREDTVSRANERIRTSTQDALRDTVQGYSSVSVDASGIELKNGCIRYALFPVWMLTTHYRGKNYVFAMNGQTGKMVGDLPVDKGAYWRWFALIAVIASALAYGLGLLLNYGGV